MVHVLIGFAEALPSPEVVFSLKSAGHRVSVFARKRGLVLERLGLEQVHVLPSPEEDAPAAIASLQTIMSGLDAPNVLLPLDDGGLWLSDAALGKDPRVAGATGDQAILALDKALQVAAAERAGLDVPPTLMVRQPRDLHSDIPLPAIAKPALAIRVRAGALGKGETTYLPDAAAVQALRASLPEDMEPLLIQPLVAGQGAGVFGYATPQGVLGWLGHRRLRMMNPHGSGSSACISAPPDAALRDKVTCFLADIGWQGPFMVELLYAGDGTAWFMELNGRMWGSLALARRQGIEYPAWAVAQVLDHGFVPEPPAPDTRPLIMRELGRDLLHLLFVLRGPKSAFHRQGWPRFWRSLAGVLKPTHPRYFYNYDPAHRGFFLRHAWATIVKTVRR